MIDKVIELKKQYVPAKFALDHLVDYARKGGGTVAGAHKVLWDFLECAAALTAAVTDKCRHSHTPKYCGHCRAFAEAAAQPVQPALQSAAQAVLDRWNSPKWEWHKNGPTADLMADLYAAIKGAQS